MKRKKITKIVSAYDYCTNIIGKDIKPVRNYYIPKIKPYIQENLGESDDLDCTITSICTIFQYITGDKINYIYNQVIRDIIPKFSYNPYKYGTIPFMIKIIIKNFNYRKSTLLKQFKVNQKLIKHLGYNKKLLIKVINKNIPILLNINGSTEDYYHNHSITIIGYIEYSNILNSKKLLLIVYDNWSTGLRYLDYDTIPLISSINYLQRGDN